MKPEAKGMIYDEPNAEYHAHKAGSCSKVKDFLDRPSLYHKKHVLRLVAHDWSDALRIGAGHHYRMEGEDAYNENCHVLPEDFSLRSKANKELWKDIIEVQARVPIKHKEHFEIIELQQSILKNEMAKALLSDGEAEVTFRQTYKYMTLQCRTDFMNFSAPDFSDFVGDNEMLREFMPDEGEPYIVDYKTCQNLNDWTSTGFNNTAHKFGYDFQDAFYTAIVNKTLADAGMRTVEKFFFIVTEKSEPKETSVFLLNTSTKERAWTKFCNTIKRLEECYKTDRWQGFPDHAMIGISDHVLDKSSRDDAEKLLTE